MKVTGQQYLNLNPDLKAAGVDALKHFLDHVCPDGPLKEPRIIDVPEPSSLPLDWNWEVYLAGWGDLRKASLDTQEEAEAHYLSNGFYEKRWPIPPLPIYWDDASYLFLYPDVAAVPYYVKFPWAHYYDSKETENRVYMPEGWEANIYLELNSDVAGDAYFGKHPLHHYWLSVKEGNPRPYKKGWIPTTPGLHHILDIPASYRPLFTGMRFGTGLLLGDYGGHLDGGQISYWDGKTITVEKKFADPKGESIFHLIAADDGVPICSIERYGMMARRNADSTWTTTRVVDEASDLAFGIFKTEGALQCLVCTSSRPTSSVIESTDQGRTWHGRWNFPEGQNTQGCSCSDGHRVLFSDKENGRPVIRDTGSNIVTSRDDLQGRGYTQVCGKDGRWNFSGNNIDARFGCFVDYWDGFGSPRTVFQSSRGATMWTEADPNSENRIALFGAWKEPDPDSELAISRDGGKTWTSVIVNCSCLFGSHFADGGVYLFGGDWGNGRVYFYHF